MQQISLRHYSARMCAFDTTYFHVSSRTFCAASNGGYIKTVLYGCSHEFQLKMQEHVNQGLNYLHMK